MAAAPGIVAIGNLAAQWLEPYAGAPSCEAAPYFKATLGVPTLSPAVNLGLGTHYGSGHCLDTLVTTSTDNRSHSFEIGTPSAAVGVMLKPKASSSLVFAASTAEGCGGGSLRADGAGYGACTRITEVDRGGGSVLLQTENGRRVRCNAGSVLADQRSIDISWTRSLSSDGFYAYKSGNKYLGVSGSSLSCTGTSLGDAQKFVRTLAPPPETYRLRNVWLGAYLVDRALGRAYYGDTAPQSLDSQWILEGWGSDHSRIKNRQTGLYLNDEGIPADANGVHIVAATAAPPNWQSSAWTLEPVDGASVRLQNAWQTGEYLNLEHQLGYAELSAVGPGWLSAQWNLERVAPLENKALAATPSGSSQSAGQGFAQARDGVVDGYPADITKEWASAGQQSGAFIVYTWSNPQTVSWIALSDRINANDQILAGRLSFSDGSVVNVAELPNDGTPLVIDFASRSVTSVQFTVTSVSPTTANVGLAEFEVH